MPDTYFPPSELIVNPDGSIFHLHLRPEQLADRIILVGDPGRTTLVAKAFDEVECRISNREFCSITGSAGGKRITVVSTGIGCDNIDIVLNELDALANINLHTRRLHPTPRRLSIVRIGTCGGLQPETPEGTFVASAASIGLDGLLHYYADREAACDTALEAAFIRHMQWEGRAAARPYAVWADAEWLDRLAGTDMVRGITVACGGFFGPQGRQLRLPLSDPEQNHKVTTFSYRGLHITNYEMESSAVAGLARLLGHRAVTCCLVSANRVAGRANTDYQQRMHQLVHTVLERI